jgi:formylglycine-generating enzyme required for sulfatase activity
VTNAEYKKFMDDNGVGLPGHENFPVNEVSWYDGSKNGDYQTKNNTSPYGAYDLAGNVFEGCLDWCLRSDNETPNSANDYLEGR